MARAQVYDLLEIREDTPPVVLVGEVRSSWYRLVSRSHLSERISMNSRIVPNTIVLHSQSRRRPLVVMRVPLRVEYLDDGRYPSRRHKHEVGETVPMYAYKELVHD